jgi:hypothetical protein
MSMGASNEVGRQRTRLNFADAVSRNFAFLGQLGFSEVESLPTLVRYRKDSLEVVIYHGRQSFEIGFELSYAETRYSMSELIRAADVEEAEKYRNYAAKTPQSIAEGLARLQRLVKQYGERALRGDSTFFSMIDEQRRKWAKGYELEVLAEQLRPKADAAFRSGNYRQAADLYEKILSRLSAAELKKLALARRRAGL